MNTKFTTAVGLQQSRLSSDATKKRMSHKGRRSTSNWYAARTLWIISALFQITGASKGSSVPGLDLKYLPLILKKCQVPEESHLMKTLHTCVEDMFGANNDFVCQVSFEKAKMQIQASAHETGIKKQILEGMKEIMNIAYRTRQSREIGLSAPTTQPPAKKELTQQNLMVLQPRKGAIYETTSDASSAFHTGDYDDKAPIDDKSPMKKSKKRKKKNKKTRTNSDEKLMRNEMSKKKNKKKKKKSKSTTKQRRSQTTDLYKAWDQTYGDGITAAHDELFGSHKGIHFETVPEEFPSGLTTDESDDLDGTSRKDSIRSFETLDLADIKILEPRKTYEEEEKRSTLPCSSSNNSTSRSGSDNCGMP